MTLFENKLWRQDLQFATEVVRCELKKLEGNQVLITGGTGLIGSAFVDLLCTYNMSTEKKIRIILASRSFEKAKSRFGALLDSNTMRWVQYDANLPIKDIDIHVDYIVHAASNAYPRLMMQEPVETMKSNFIGLNNLLELARINNSKRLLYVSSSEVYGRISSPEPLKEEEYGYIDVLNPRNVYSIAKRASEALCIGFSNEFGVDSVIVRPGHIYGPTSSQNDNRVSSAFAHAVARGEDIILKSEGASLRSYCYCIDCASAILCVLLNGELKNAYNVSNRNSIISIKEMAEMLVSNSGSSLIFETATLSERQAFNNMDNSALNSSKLEKLGWKAQFDPKEGLNHTVQIIRDVFYH